MKEIRRDGGNIDKEAAMTTTSISTHSLPFTGSSSEISKLLIWKFFVSPSYFLPLVLHLELPTSLILGGPPVKLFSQVDILSLRLTWAIWARVKLVRRTVRNPHVLLLSGIGPKHHLDKLNVSIQFHSVHNIFKYF